MHRENSKCQFLSYLNDSSFYFNNSLIRALFHAVTDHIFANDNTHPYADPDYKAHMTGPRVRGLTIGSAIPTQINKKHTMMSAMARSPAMLASSTESAMMALADKELAFA